MVMLDLRGKTIVVIGGARGIGASTCIIAAQSGANIAWTHLGSTENIRGNMSLKQKIDSIGVKYMERIVDCTDEQNTIQFIRDVEERLGSPDGLVYCAGWTSPVSFLNIDSTNLRRIIEINLTGAFFAIHAVLPYFIKKGSGSIVLVGSAAIVSGGGGRADYVAAKAGLEGLNRAIAREFGPKGIRCNIVHPSLIDTDLLKTRYPSSEIRNDLIKEVPLRRLGQPEDVAYAIIFLLSDKASYITGQALYIDGGRTFCK